MEEAGTSSGSNLCQICNTAASRYTCPRCSMPYCSIDCYKSTNHLDCSEEFYKEWVETEMKVDSNDPERRKRMTDILQRIHEQDNRFAFEDDDGDVGEAFDGIDSDDDDDVPDLADRVKNVNLDDADALWSVLTDAERQEFEAILKNGEEKKLLPQWTPWWTVTEKIKLIEEVDVNEKDEFAERCPKVLDIPEIAAVEKASPTVSFNMVNILHSYIVTVLHYDGDHQNSAGEAVSMFLQLNDVIGSNQVFENAEAAVKAVMKKAFDYQLLSGEEEGVMTNYLRQMINGPSTRRPSLYVCAALSDLHRLFTKAKKELSTKSDIGNPAFTKRFQAHIDRQYLNLSKKNIPLYLKKIEYYLAWACKCGTQMMELKFSGINKLSDVKLFFKKHFS